MGLRQTRFGVVATLVLVIGLATSGSSTRAEARTVPLECVNNSSGYHWSVLVDFDHGKVDSLPAEISTDTISWYDPKDQGFYDLDATSGALTVRHASSVGGYFLYHTCHLG